MCFLQAPRYVSISVNNTVGEATPTHRSIELLGEGAKITEGDVMSKSALRRKSSSVSFEEGGIE